MSYHEFNDLRPDAVMTAEKRLREDAEKGRQAAERAAAAKDRLVWAVSHDLRQPLQSLTLFAQVIEADTNLSMQSRIALGHLQGSLSHMGQLLDSVLHLAKLNTGSLVGNKGIVELNPLLSELADEMAPQARAKGLDLRVVATSARVESDPVLLRTMLRNLVANAVRYTETGKVLIGCRPRDKQVSIAVYDTGIGIEADKLRLVFEEFYQVEGRSGDGRHGLGLGLSIVERMATLLGHRLTVRSEQGKGSMFGVLVPAASV